MPPTPQALTYQCPPGDTLTLSNGLCITTFGDPRETFEEPYLAVHPAQPEIMALGLNAWHADPRPVLRDGVPSMELGRVALFVTQDGGGTWDRVLSPPILYGADVGKASYSGDPVLGFDSRGTLHYLQTSVAFDGLDMDSFPYIDIQYARSEDLGASWSKNMLLAEGGDNDRPWLTIGADDQLFVTWRNNIVADGPPELAKSTDGGDTWETYVAPPDCTHGDRALVHASGVLVPCSLHEDGMVTGFQINRLDPENEQFEPVAQIPTPDGYGPGPGTFVQWDLSPTEDVVGLATRQADGDGFIAFSRDGGANWSAPIKLIDVCGCEPETGSVHTYGAMFDAWGGFHIMLTDAYVETPDNWGDANNRYASGERAVFHVVVDAYGRPIQQKTLFTSIQQDPRVPPSAAPPIGRDEYFIPAFWGEGGSIVWTRDKGVDLTWIMPTQPPA